ncbi:unnamed protein product, partial [Closterium sp. NIES-64]
RPPWVRVMAHDENQQQHVYLPVPSILLLPTPQPPYSLCSLGEQQRAWCFEPWTTATAGGCWTCVHSFIPLYPPWQFKGAAAGAFIHPGSSREQQRSVLRAMDHCHGRLLLDFKGAAACFVLRAMDHSHGRLLLDVQSPPPTSLIPLTLLTPLTALNRPAVEGVYLEDEGQSAAPGGPYRPIKYWGGTDIVWRGEIEPIPLRQVVVHAMAVWLAGMAAEELITPTLRILLSLLSSLLFPPSPCPITSAPFLRLRSFALPICPLAHAISCCARHGLCSHLPRSRGVGCCTHRTTGGGDTGKGTTGGKESSEQSI